MVRVVQKKHEDVKKKKAEESPMKEDAGVEATPAKKQWEE